MAPSMEGTGIELRNGRTKVIVEPRSGSILRIEDVATGLAHIDANRGSRADGRLYRLLVPTEAWWSCYADSQDQTQVECEHKGNRVTLDYPDLKAADGQQTGVAVRIDIRAGDMPDEFRLSMRIENHGQRTVLDTAFPLLGGWHEPGTASRFALGANSFFAPRSLAASAGNNYARNGRRADWHYPVSLACPWVDVSGPDGGLAYLNYMAEGRNGKFWIENLAGYGDDFRLMFGWSHFLALRPGESWTSPPMGLAAHPGDWRATADRYSRWFDALRPPDYSRPDIRSRIGFQNAFFRGFDGTPIRALETIPQVAAAGRRYGVDMLCVWDMLTLGNYARHNPHDLTDYSAEDREILARGLRQAEAEGTRTCALINFRHPNVALHLPDPDLSSQVQRRYTGTLRTENWTGNHTFGGLWAKHIGPESYVFSPFSQFHRERVLRLARDYVSLGYSSMFYDQPFEHDPDYGSANCGHSPDATHHEALQLVGEVRKLLLAKDPLAVVIGEESDIHATPFIDQWMSWSIASPSPPLIERVTMMRYAMPHTILSWVVDHEPERAAIAFAMGMQLCLMVHGAEGIVTDEPRFAERIHALARLRKQTAGRTVMARFRGQDGLTVDGDSGFAAFAYESQAGPAIIVAACGASAKGKVTVSLGALAATSLDAEGVVFGLDGSRMVHTGTTCGFDLGKNDVAVWTL
ncbi:MAG: hypothetical protein HN849_11615 [Victivallales bacterium]|jgi:hypothetical protein|nr:hypothetical protein [Victivallales bacterium]